jgi:hypothetical protein
LVGRIDMKASRGVLEVKALWMEPGRRLSRGRRDRLQAELERIRRFIGAEVLVFADDHLKHL